MAIDEALRRFDGEEARPRAGRRITWGAPLRAMLGRPQMAAFATIVLVAFIGLPLWLSDIGPRVQRDTEISERSSPRQASLDVEAEPLSPPASLAPPARAREEISDERERPIMAEGEPAAVASADALPVETPPRPTSEQADRFQPAEGVRSDERERSPSPRPATRPGTEDRAIIVTGGRVAGPPAAPAADRQQAPVFAEPGDWNACTILDTRHNLQACHGLADPTRTGRAGRSAAHFLDGLRLAWEGDLDGALESFDRSIALAPDLSIAYLNRGLAYRQKGDADRALADFGRAIASDPDAAAAYYHRGHLLRAQGKTARAEADMERAIRLAPK